MKTIILLGLLCVCTIGRRTLPEYEINLDLPAGKRFEKVITDFKEPTLAAMNEVFNTKLKALHNTLTTFAKIRGPETREMQEEIKAFATGLGVSVHDIQILNWLSELASIMIPDHIKKGLSFIQALDLFTQPMCTGILAYDPEGSVNHARNLDFSPADYLNKILYTGVFTKGGKEVFRAQMIVGFSGIITGFKQGAFSVEINTRFSSYLGQNGNTLANLVLRRTELAAWAIRKSLENDATFEEGVETLSTVPFTAPIYLTIGGVRQGTILARNPDSVAHQLVLGDEENPRYIVITNFDYWNDDWREWFDPTADFHRRRVGVMRDLDSVQDITQEVLFATINDPDVMAKDTLFQAVMNVETGYYNTSTPYDL